MPSARGLLFVFGTLKRGFPLHGDLDGEFVGPCETAQPHPMVIAGPRYAPMMFDEPGLGRIVHGELYRVDEAALERLDAVESVGQPGNFRRSIEVLLGPQRLQAWAYLKARDLANPRHSEYLADYRDDRFVPPDARPEPDEAPKKRRAIAHHNQDARAAVADVVSRFQDWRYALALMAAKTGRACSEAERLRMQDECRAIREQLADARTELIVRLADAPPKVSGHSRVVDVERALDSVVVTLEGIERGFAGRAGAN